MSPKFYGLLWVLFGVSAGVLWLAGAFTMLTLVVFGFVAFGFTFMGMMCVLPGAVGHSHETRAKASVPKKSPRKPSVAAASHVPLHSGLRTH